MIRGIRRPEEIAHLGLSSRIMVRVGALLKKRIAVSLPVLESARGGSGVEGLLLEPSLLENSETLDLNRLKQLAELRPDTSKLVFGIAAAEDGVRVICLQEELETDDGWGVNPAPAAAAAVAPTEAGSALARTDAATRSSTDGGGLFSRSEIERWRLKLSTASAANERLEALRTLTLAPLNNSEKLDVLLQGLSDRDGSVRAEAAGLLASLGADKDVADALSALNHPDAARRVGAAERLLKLLSTAANASTAAATFDLEIGSVAVCSISMLRFQADPGMTGQLLSLLGVCAPALGRNAERLAEVVRILAGLIDAASKNRAPIQEMDALLFPAHRLIAALSRAVPDTLYKVLQAEHERCSDLLIEAFVLHSMLDIPNLAPDAEEKLLTDAVSYLTRDTDEGRDSRAIGARLTRRGEKALLALVDGFAEAHMGAQKYFLILFDDIYRMNKISVEALERAAKLALHTIETGSKGLRMAAMECRLIADQEVSEETRGKLTKAILGSISDFIFRSDIEKIESTLSRMGLPAVPPLLEQLSPEHTPEDRARAVRLLGQWSLNVKAPRGQIARLQQTVTDVLRRLQALSLDAEFPDRGELLCALGKLVASPAASKEADVVISRNLLDAAKGNDPKVVPLALDGLSYAAASRRAQPDFIHATSELLRHVLDETVLDIDTQSKSVDGETVIEIKGGEQYTKLLPIIVKGLGRVACSASCPPAIMRDIGQVLLSRWKKVCNGELIWGPANSALLVQALKDMGCHKNFPPELRLEILKSFGPKHVQTSIMHALTEILAADDTQATAVGAVTIGFAILGRRGKEGQFAVEDREDILKALARIVGRKILGGASQEAQQKANSLRKLAVDELFKGLKDIVPQSYEALVGLRENVALSEELRKDIERRLKDYQAIVVA